MDSPGVTSVAQGGAMSGSSAANRMLFDNKIFKVSLPTLSTDASVEDLNNHMFHVVGDKVAVQAGGAYVQTFIHHHCGVHKKSTATMPSGMTDDDVWYFHDDPGSPLIWAFKSPNRGLATTCAHSSMCSWTIRTGHAPSSCGAAAELQTRRRIKTCSDRLLQ